MLLLATGFYIEANLIMASIVENVLSSLIIKVLLPAVALLYTYIRIKKATNIQLKQSNIIMNFILVVYVLINLFHILWLSSLPIFIHYFNQ